TAPIVVTNAEYRFLVADQAQEQGVALETILLEPSARNTAAAIAAAAHVASQQDEEAVLHILPSDPLVTADDGAVHCVGRAQAAARDGYLVTFGINPSWPETGYGYIAVGEGLGNGTHKVARFVEKPVAPEAERMLAEGGFVWNSGMFM